MRRILGISLLVFILGFGLKSAAFAQTLVVDEWGRLHIVLEGQVLGKGSDDGGGGVDSGSSSGSGSSGSTEQRHDSSDDRSGEGASAPAATGGSAFSGPGSGRQETKIKVRTPEGRFEEEVKTRSDGTVEFRQEVRTAQGVQRIRVKDGKLEIRVKPAQVEEGEDLDELDELAEELGEEEEESRVVERIKVRERADKNEVEIRAAGTRLEIRQGRVRARTNFPLSIGPNNELIVTTPAGAREVAILPDTAVARLLASGVLSSVAFATEQAGQTGATGQNGVGELEEELEAEFEEEGATGAVGATGEEGAARPVAPSEATAAPEVALTEERGVLVYKVNGTKTVRLLGLAPVVAPVSANVSAETGAVLSVAQPWYLDLFGFLFR